MTPHRTRRLRRAQAPMQQDTLVEVFPSRTSLGPRSDPRAQVLIGEARLRSDTASGQRLLGVDAPVWCARERQAPPPPTAQVAELDVRRSRLVTTSEGQ